MTRGGTRAMTGSRNQPGYAVRTVVRSVTGAVASALFFERLAANLVGKPPQSGITKKWYAQRTLYGLWCAQRILMAAFNESHAG